MNRDCYNCKVLLNYYGKIKSKYNKATINLIFKNSVKILTLIENKESKLLRYLEAA